MARVSIEDCLSVLENRFALVQVAANRTRQLMEGDEPLVKTKNKLGVTALREVADGYISTSLPPELGNAARRQAAAKARAADQENEK